MEGDLRRNEILQIISKASGPVSGTQLSKTLGVSRQIIVQDIALLRASNRNIISTNKGYTIYEDNKENAKRIFYVSHNDLSVGDELNTIVDNGGRVLDVVVEHEIYGQISVDLVINSRRDVNEFLWKMSATKDKPLSVLTSGEHYHTVIADNESTLDDIEKALREKGYLK